MKRAAFLLASMGFHGAVGLWLFSMDTKPSPEEEKIQIEIQESKPKPALKGRARGRGQSKSKGGKGLGAFVPSAAGMFKAPGNDYYDRVYAEAKGSSEWPEDSFGSHGTDLGQYAEHAGHLDQLREEIENMLFYPGVLSRRKIKGAIHARLYFAKDSQCAFKKTRVNGAEPYLRVYILALISKLCDLSAVGRMGFRDGQYVDLSFDFYISENPVSREMDEARSRVQGNVILFQRGFMDSSLEWKLGPIRGTWFAPMVFLDFPWIMENWEKYVDKKDPLREFKN